MPDFKLPLSGNVSQTINPWTLFFNPVGSQFGFFNINLGTSSNPDVEEQVLSDVASYGKQLGRIEDALCVLLKHFHPQTKLTEDEDRAIRDLERMVEDIQDIKDRHLAPRRPQSAVAS
jgi:hypothetical protein